MDAVALRKVEITGTGGRFVHMLIDYLLMNLFWWAINLVANVSFVSSSFRLYMGSSEIVFSFDFMLIILFYYPFFEGLFQTTPGKLLTGSVVIDEYAEKPGFDKIFIRSLIRLIPFEAFSVFAGRGWHDRWSDTWVVKRSEAEKLQELLAAPPAGQSPSA